MPTAIILAGPNGAGKTTFAKSYFREIRESPLFLNTDEVARELRDIPAGPQRDWRAGRLMLERLNQAVNARASFVVETTLSSRLYAKHIKVWRNAGYHIALLYIRLSSVEASLERVRHRVSRGGHDVPDADVFRRFGRSLSNLETVYKPIVDEWQVWESLDGDFSLVGRSFR